MEGVRKIKAFYRKVMGAVAMFTVSFFCNSLTANAAPKYDEYDLQSYKSYVNQDGIEMIASAINALANLLFGITKAIYILADTAVEVLYGMDVINQFSATISSVANELYNLLYSGVGILVVLIAFVYIAWQYMTTQDVVSALRKLVCLGLVVGISVVWLPNTSTYLNKLNEISMDIQSAVMGVGNDFEGTDAVRQSYFEVAIYEPYLLMNYGTTEEGEVNAGNASRSASLLYGESTDSDDAHKANEDYIMANESDNDYMSKTSVGYKFVIALVSIAVSLLYAILLIGASLMNFAVQVAILLLAVALPISIIVSFFPRFWTAGFKVLGSIGILFCVQIFVGLAVSAVFTLNNVIDKLIVGTSTDVTGAGEYMLEVLITFVIVILAFKYRNSIISTVTGGAVTKVNIPVVSEVADDVYSGAKKAGGMAVTAATGLMTGVEDDVEVLDGNEAGFYGEDSGIFDAEFVDNELYSDDEIGFEDVPLLEESNSLSEEGVIDSELAEETLDTVFVDGVEQSEIESEVDMIDAELSEETLNVELIDEIEQSEIESEVDMIDAELSEETLNVELIDEIEQSEIESEVDMIGAELGEEDLDAKLFDEVEQSGVESEVDMIDAELGEETLDAELVGGVEQSEIESEVDTIDAELGKESLDAELVDGVEQSEIESEEDVIAPELGEEDLDAELVDRVEQSEIETLDTELVETGRMETSEVNESESFENESLENEQVIEEMFEQPIENMNENDFMFDATFDLEVESLVNPGTLSEPDMGLVEQFESDLLRLRGE